MIKVGDKVREIETGDIGTVTGKHTAGWCEGWWVSWETGGEQGKNLHIAEEAIEVVEPTVPSTIAECIKMLIDAGYTVTKGK